MRIVIVDTGVKLERKQFKRNKFLGFGICNKEIKDDYIDYSGHGSAIYGIIENCSQSYEIINIKVFQSDEDIDEEDLIYTLNYIYENINCDIINLSLGLSICTNHKKLSSICEKLYKRGTIIVAAFDNVNSMSYPAAYECVIGVTNSNECKKISDFQYIEDDIVNIAAKGGIQRLIWNKPDYIMLGGNSFACAHVTVQVAKFLEEGASTKQEVLQMFKNKSVNKFTLISQKPQKTINKIYKAVIFPFNKEMHSLIRYSDMLSFEIIGLYDTKYSINIGSTTTHVLDDENIPNYLIQNISNIKWEEFDTIILGHMDELSSLMDKSELKEMIIKEAINNNKNIYAFDDISKYTESYNKSYCPVVLNENLPPDRFGKMYRISKPVLGIFGTSSRQGKFTLQLKIRELLIKNGYNIGQIGSEPSALLYEMDYVYPMGYNSSVYTQGFDSIRYLNFIENELCKQDKDIIIVGSQSGTVTFDIGNIVQYNLNQYEFLLGTQPDAVILNVNPYDDIEYITRTIKFIEATVICKVIAIVVFPMNLNNNWTGIYGGKTKLDMNSYYKLKANLQDIFKIPVFKLGDEVDMETLTTEVVGFFSSNN